MKRLIYPCLILLIACTHSSTQKGLIYYNDMESVKGWADVNLSNDFVHSGIFSNKLDTTHPYGIVFNQLFKKISDEKTNKISVSMWVYITPKAKGNIVLEIHNHNDNRVLWDAKRFDSSTVKPNQWQLVSKDFTIKDSINNPENKVIIYPWCDGKNDFYIDDITIDFSQGKAN